MSNETQIKRELVPILSNMRLQSAPETLDAVVCALVAAHPKYNRTNQANLKRVVERALAGLRDGGSKEAGSSTVAETAPQARVASLNNSLYGGGGGGGGAGAGAAAPAAAAPAPAAEGRALPASAAGKKRVRESAPAAAVEGGGRGGEEPWRLPDFVQPRERLADVGGMGAVLRVLHEAVAFPLRNPQVYHHLGVEPPRGVLLHGPPGCGKTLLARALAGELGDHGVYFRAVTGPELVGGVSGESESRLRAVFQDAEDRAPSLLFIDELDVLAPKLEASARGMERRMVSQLLTCIDGLAARAGGEGGPRKPDGLAACAGGEGGPRKPVMLLAATSKPDSLDAALRRTGRFDKELALPIPDESAREAILRVLTRNCNLGPPAGARPDLRALARITPGYVGADLAALVKEAAVGAIERVLREGGGGGGGEDMGHSSEIASLVNLFLSHGDFEAAVARVQPSATREGFAMVPNVSWDDVGALAQVRDELSMAILQPLRRPEAFRALGLTVPAGVLLYGPPGCGKTLLAKAIAAESAANFIAVKGPELLDKYVGESERAVRALFSRARASAPCIVFFDEMDALAPRRGGGGGGGASDGGSVTERVVNQLLTEMDGLETRRDVFVIAATNRPDIIDPAMLRPGRLDKLLFVPLPTAGDRAAILKTQARKMPVDADVDFDALAAHPRAARFSGADLAALNREAAVGVLREFFALEAVGGAGVGTGAARGPRAPAMRDFIAAFEKVNASVSPSDERKYDALRLQLRGGGE